MNEIKFDGINNEIKFAKLSQINAGINPINWIQTDWRHSVNWFSLIDSSLINWLNWFGELIIITVNHLWNWMLMKWINEMEWNRIQT